MKLIEYTRSKYHLSQRSLYWIDIIQRAEYTPDCTQNYYFCENVIRLSHLNNLTIDCVFCQYHFFKLQENKASFLSFKILSINPSYTYTHKKKKQKKNNKKVKKKETKTNKQNILYDKLLFLCLTTMEKKDNFNYDLLFLSLSQVIQNYEISVQVYLCLILL